ncbi:hypothetical protein AB0D61_49525, partial [Streptomyces sp. NPDC048341]
GEYLLGGATSSSFPCSGQPYWMPVRKLRGPSAMSVSVRMRMGGRPFGMDAAMLLTKPSSR